MYLSSIIFHPFFTIQCTLLANSLIVILNQSASLIIYASYKFYSSFNFFYFMQWKYPNLYHVDHINCIICSTYVNFILSAVLCTVVIISDLPPFALSTRSQSAKEDSSSETWSRRIPFSSTWRTYMIRCCCRRIGKEEREPSP